MLDETQVRAFFERQVILVLNDEFWDRPKRLRHRMSQQWARHGARVLWLERPPGISEILGCRGAYPGVGQNSLRGVEPRLWVGRLPCAPPRWAAVNIRASGLLRAAFRPLYLRRIRKYLAELKLEPTLLVIFQDAAAAPYARSFPSATSIYYSTDIYGYYRQSAATEAIEESCCRAVDAVFATSSALRDRLAPFNPRIELLPHAVDRAWWEAAPREEPAEYRRIPGPRVVFAGVLTPKIDFELLSSLAREMPACNFIFVGPAPEARDRPAAADDLLSLPNCHFLGEKPFEDVPAYLRHATCLMLPYRTTTFTRHIGLPLKFFEYAISGRPVLASPFTDFEPAVRDAIYCCASVGDWQDTLCRLIAQREMDDDRRTRRLDLAMQNTYDHRLARQAEVLMQVQSRIG